jgi:hypothetical protein
MRERPLVVRDVEAVALLTGSRELDERARRPVRPGTAAVRVVKMPDLPPVDQQLDQVAQASELVALLGDVDASGRRVVRS